MTEREKLAAKVNPAMKEWIDRVIVPGLVRAYLKHLQENDSLVARVVPNSTLQKPFAEVCQ